MQKKVKMLFGLLGLAAVVLVSCQRLPVSAAQQETLAESADRQEALPYILDTDRECEIRIQTDVKQNTAGEKLAIYQVGLVDATSLSLSYVLTDTFEETKADLTGTENAKRAQAIETLREYAEKKQVKPDAIVVIQEDGTAQLKVPQGAYLICQVKEEAEPDEAASEAESQTVIQPALVGIPYVGESLDSWVYELEVQLKAAQKNIATGDLQDPLWYGALAGTAGVLLGLLLLARKRGKKA